MTSIFDLGACGLFLDGTILYLGGNEAVLNTSGGARRRNLAAWDLSMTTGVDPNLRGGIEVALAPNPTSGSTRVRLTLVRDGHVRVQVFDLLGREVARLADRHVPAGSLELERNGVTRTGKRESGIYFVRVDAGGWVTAKRLALLR